MAGDLRAADELHEILEWCRSMPEWRPEWQSGAIVGIPSAFYTRLRNFALGAPRPQPAAPESGTAGEGEMPPAAELAHMSGEAWANWANEGTSDQESTAFIAGYQAGVADGVNYRRPAPAPEPPGGVGADPWAAFGPRHVQLCTSCGLPLKERAPTECESVGHLMYPRKVPARPGAAAGE